MMQIQLKGIIATIQPFSQTQLQNEDYSEKCNL